MRHLAHSRKNIVRDGVSPFCHILRRNLLVTVAPDEGHLVTDAHLAAIAVEHGCELMSTDLDFSRFPGLRWRNPLT